MRKAYRCSTLPLGLMLLGMVLSLAACAPDNTETSSPAVSEALGNPNQESLKGFKRAIEVREFSFPHDHNFHPGYRNEWWYFTGNLQSSDGAEYGYQVTFFRVALAPPMDNSQQQRATSSWATHVVWMAHAAITDINNARHLHEERFTREAAGLAGNQQTPFRVWLDDWRLVAEDEDFPWQIQIKGSKFSIQLTLSPESAVMLQGDRGLSQKSAEPGNASYYYSIPRLSTQGRLVLGDKSTSVSGTSWLDREWSTSALGSDQEGWDWFSLHLDSGAELMFYQLRTKDGVADPHSKGVFRAGRQRTNLTLDNTKLIPLDHWPSPAGKRYPIRWRLQSSDLQKDWIIEAAVDDQLMETFVEYWEGAVRVFDAATNNQVGVGYLEMTGY